MRRKALFARDGGHLKRASNVKQQNIVGYHHTQGWGSQRSEDDRPNDARKTQV